MEDSSKLLPDHPLGLQVWKAEHGEADPGGDQLSTGGIS